MSKQAPPQQDEVLGYFTDLSNWGRWGDDDQRGTLNHITADARKRGAAAVRHGISVSCAWELGTGPGGIERTTHAFAWVSDSPSARAAAPESLDDQWGAAGEHVCLSFHGFEQTHVDSLCHMFWQGRMYNGRPAELVDAVEGALWGSVTAAADGMVTRGVLLDVATLRGVARLGPGEGVFPEDLEAAEERQGVRVEPGDAVLLRTGMDRHRHETGADWQAPDRAQPGWHASCLPWLHERGVAYIGADMSNDVVPSGYPNVSMPVHSCGIVAMGLWLLDNCDLSACADTAERLQQWDFNLSVSPLRFTGTTGSPVNPIATF